MSLHCSINVSVTTTPERTIEAGGTSMETQGNNACVRLDDSTQVWSKVKRNALGLTGFGSFSPQPCPDMIGLY